MNALPRTSTPNRSVRSALVCLFVLLSPCIAGVAGAQESKTELSILGFTKDAKQMLVKIDDINVGLALRLYDVESGQPIKKAALLDYTRGDEVQTVKKARKRYKIVDEGIESMKTADEAIAFFGVEKGENLVIAATDYKRLGKITAVELKSDPETKVKAAAVLKAIVWTTDRKTMVLVVHQKIKGTFLYEKDYFHAVPFSARRIQWVEAEPKKEDKEKDKEKKEESSWWPF
jgi:hypothetical protein